MVLFLWGLLRRIKMQNAKSQHNLQRCCENVAHGNYLYRHGKYLLRQSLPTILPLSVKATGLHFI